MLIRNGYYLAGGKKTIADIAIVNEIASIITIYDELKLTPRSFPNLYKWYVFVSSLDCVKTGNSAFSKIWLKLNA